jgi:hypothetical protein
MKTSSYTILPETTHGVASENYDGVSTDFAGIPSKAAAYYTKDKGLQTIAWFLNNFEGILHLEATLDSDNNNASWFSIGMIDGSISPLTENEVENIEGNFTWIRVRVEGFLSGSITKVVLSY